MTFADTTTSLRCPFDAPPLPDKPRGRPLGHWGEDCAAAYLAHGGYEILDRNWRVRGGELDIVAFCPEREALVAVEVKTRRYTSHVSAIDAVSDEKARRVAGLLSQWLMERDAHASRIAIDLVAITVGERRTWSLRHLKDVNQ